MNLSHRLLSSALLAGAALSITVLPLTTLGSKSVTIQLEERPVFVGQLRELARPYLALATGISLGVGVVSLAVASWRSATHQLEQRDAEVSTLKRQLDEKNALVERLRFSDTRLQSSGLEQFLQAEDSIALRSVAASTPEAITPETTPRFNRPAVAHAASFDRPAIPHTPLRSSFPASKFSTAGLEFFLDDETELFEIPESVPSVQPPPKPLPSRAARSVQPSPYADFTVTPITEPVKIQAVSSLPAAQSFNGFVRPDTAGQTASTSPSLPESSIQLHELLGHLKQVMTQIERLQNSQSPTPSSRKNSSGL